MSNRYLEKNPMYKITESNEFAFKCWKELPSLPKNYQKLVLSLYVADPSTA